MQYEKFVIPSLFAQNFIITEFTDQDSFIICFNLLQNVNTCCVEIVRLLLTGAGFSGHRSA